MKLWICGTSSNRKNDAQKQQHKSRGLLSGPKKSKVKEVSADDNTLSPRSDQETLDCSFETTRTPPKTKNVAFDLGDRDDSRIQDQSSLVDDTADNDKLVDDGSSSSRGSFSTSSTSPKNRKKFSWFRPSAREAAFSGPPKYEWADVETTAAVKIQSVVRYVQTRDFLEHDGFTTAHMRNRIRERKATNNAAWRRVITDDVPGMFRCCGVGLLFGDTQEETWITRDAQAREAAKKKKLRQFQREDELRENYMNQRPMEKWEFLEEDD